MNIQSLSIVVPNKKCINDCKFCVSKMHNEDYKNQLDANLPFYDLYLKDYLKRLEFARDNGCNTVMLTGNSEPQQNRHFLMTFGLLMQIMRSPFRWVEMQTTGTLLDKNYLRFLRNHVGVNTISLSISSFNDKDNNEIIGAKVPINLIDLCEEIKLYDFTLRLSINLNSAFANYKPKDLFTMVKLLGAEQVTFRKLYTSPNNTPQDKWIEENKYPDEKYEELKEYVRTNGRQLEILPFGNIKWSVDGISTVIDGDCMSQELKQDYKYLILREDCKLYSKWDDKASIIF